MGGVQEGPTQPIHYQVLRVEGMQIPAGGSSIWAEAVTIDLRTRAQLTHRNISYVNCHSASEKSELQVLTMVDRSESPPDPEQGLQHQVQSLSAKECQKGFAHVLLLPSGAKATVRLTLLQARVTSETSQRAPSWHRLYKAFEQRLAEAHAALRQCAADNP